MSHHFTRSLAGLLLVLLCLSAPVRAQENSPADKHELPIAVLNMDKVFAGYKKHSERLQPLRDSAMQLDETVKVRQVELETTANQLRRAQPGSPEQQRLQVLAVKLQTELRQFVEQERQKLQKREVSVLVASQADINEQVKKICQTRGLKLVLRQNELPTEDQPLQEVLKNLGRDVIYQDGLDITEEVLKALNKSDAN
jgi:Skp family chaperone for outer membrane proteins